MFSPRHPVTHWGAVRAVEARAFRSPLPFGSPIVQDLQVCGQRMTATPGMDEFLQSKIAIFGVYVNILGKGELCQILKYVNVFQHISVIESHAGTLMHFGCQTVSMPHRKHWCLQNSINCATLPCIEPCKRSNLIGELCGTADILLTCQSQAGSGRLVALNPWSNANQC